MKIFVSACLLGENCKYNGGNNYSEKVADFIKGHEVVALCPEVAGGLPVPRACAEIVDGIVKTAVITITSTVSLITSCLPGQVILPHSSFTDLK